MKKVYLVKAYASVSGKVCKITIILESIISTFDSSFYIVLTKEIGLIALLYGKTILEKNRHQFISRKSGGDIRLTRSMFPFHLLFTLNF